MPPQSDQPNLQEDELAELSLERQRVKDRTLNLNVMEIYATMRKFDYSTVIWTNVLSMIVIHVLALRGLYLLLTLQFKWLTLFITYAYVFFTTCGITMGAHRLWAHRSYKARFPLRVVLAIMQTIAYQRDIYDWVRDHRVHHKFSETEADPHNAQRGLFFAHMGWLMCRKGPQVIAQGKKIDFSDLLSDPIVAFQRKYYRILSIFITIFIPCFIPCYFAGETLSTAFYIAVMLRYTFGLHGTWSVNSFAHWIGNRPFDGYIYPTQNKWVSIFTGGEGWHNYHHAFPYDYRAAELGGIFQINLVSVLIDLSAKVGLAYDLKIPSDEAIERKAKNNGDGTFCGLGKSN